ncbi:hypothetical protein BD311DRAFT_776590 [Dichomitus squalens]|uniref:F-box domain-containing protein n=1 Tax=Dichomitus squalens TaxID=114155 RepID=A0A4V2K101_9APHY|nr:hypothetical protein BD311DRAFT_776590 [Dichomitus squalens]
MTPMMLDYNSDLNSSISGPSNASSISRLEGVHLLRNHLALVDAFEGMMASPILRPRLKALSLEYHNDDRRCEPFFILGPAQYPELEHLCLEGVPILLLDPTLRQSFPSLTHLVIVQSASDSIHAQIHLLVHICPNLRNVVLSNVSPHVNPPGVPTPLPESARVSRVILHDMSGVSLRFYLSLFPPHHHPMALQVFHDTLPVSGFNYEHLLRDRLQGRPTHLQVAVFPDSTTSSGGFKFSVTVATARNAVRVGSNVNLLCKSHYGLPDVWLNSLLWDAGVDLSSVREAWLVNVAAPFTALVAPFNSSAVATLRQLPALETVVLVTIDHPSNGPGNAYWPDVSVLPDTAHADFFTVHLKTLRLVYYDACPPSVCPFSRENIKLGFWRMLEQLASGAYRYLEHIIVQLSPRFEIEDAETVVGELEAYFRTVSIQRIVEMPQMPLPPCCVEPDSGPGGSYTWTDSIA